MKTNRPRREALEAAEDLEHVLAVVAHRHGLAIRPDVAELLDDLPRLGVHDHHIAVPGLRREDRDEHLGAVHRLVNLTDLPEPGPGGSESRRKPLTKPVLRRSDTSTERDGGFHRFLRQFAVAEWQGVRVLEPSVSSLLEWDCHPGRSVSRTECSARPVGLQAGAVPVLSLPHARREVSIPHVHGRRSDHATP